jgi:DNA-binding CsgD family transcriptional regulator
MRSAWSAPSTYSVRMAKSDSLAAGRAAFDERRWRDAFELLSAADRASPLDVDDLHGLATAAYLTGDAAWSDAWARAHHLSRDRGDIAGAAHFAFWLVFAFFNEGEIAQGGGWIARGQRLVDALRGNSVDAGYLLLPAAIAGCDGDPETSLVAFRRALEIGEQYHDADLIALARHGEARCIIVLGNVPAGMAMLDEVLVAVASGEVSPIVAGDTYCGAVEACQITFDVRRARAWTAALDSWCASQPGLHAFRGQCLVYLSAVTQTRGDWPGASHVAAEACHRLSEPTLQPAIGAAYYQRAELERLRGELVAAEEWYRLAGEHGRDPQPGLAQLRLAQGQIATALASVRRKLDESAGPVPRSAALPAQVEITLAAGDVASARAAADELRHIADTFASPYLGAQALYAAGAVLVAEARHAEALPLLRSACATFRDLDAPYDGARARVLIGVSCDALGDDDGAGIEWQAARRTFEGLGAAPDLARLVRLSKPAPELPGGLTARELDILRLVATGRTNRAIGDELVISEKTVARHVSNIFNKLGVSSRTAAAAYAYDHRLV